MQNANPGFDSSRTDPGGGVLLFQSEADLTGFDPEGVPQIYRYDSAAGRLHCLSCVAAATTVSGAALETVSLEQAAPPALYPPSLLANLTPDGKRAFFESTEALVARDSDGLRDVYEWEEQGTGGCARYPAAAST